MKLTTTTAVAVSLLAAISCDTSSALPHADNPGTVSIAYLKSLCSGTVYDIRTDISISGTVVANDLLC